MLKYILIIIVLFYIILNINNIEYYKNSFNTNDLKFIPYSDSKETNALNSYIIRPKKITNPSGFISSVLDANKNYNNWEHVFQFPVQDSRKSIYSNDLNVDKNYYSYFRPIIKSSKDIHKQYELENKLDESLINDPNYVYVNPHNLENTIDYNPKNKNDTLYTLLTDHKYKHIHKFNTEFPTVNNHNGKIFKCPPGFRINNKNRHKLLSKDNNESMKIACELL
tara:strand:+ start:7077 stop:7745 length:669 start_codon:yes stop_codon:yes gene_type:complete